MSRLELTQLTKCFGHAPPVVDHISLAIESGELLTIVGPTGSGKTTLLRLIAGLETPSAGDIRCDGHSILATPAWQRGVGFVFQHPALLPHQTVRAQLQLALAKGSPRLDDVLRDELGPLRLEPLLNRYPEQLSGGERQRAALGTTLVGAPRFVLLDEPLGHLDQPQRLELRRLIQSLHRRRRTTIVYVTHEQSEALGLGERVAVLRSGRLEQSGTPSAVYEVPASRFVAQFVGHPPMNILPGTLATDRGIVKFLAFNQVWVVDNLPHLGVQSHVPSPVLWGQRPEKLRLEPIDQGSAIVSGVSPVGVALRNDSASWEVEVVAVVPQGARTWVDVAPWSDAASFGPPWIVEITGEQGWRPGDRARMTWNWTNAHWFDTTTGERLPLRSTAR